MSAAIPDPEFSDVWAVTNAAIANVHPPVKCAGQACVIHSPSDHHMRRWSLVWRNDKRTVERVCAHGVGHPDPDDVAYRLSLASQWGPLNGLLRYALSLAVHSCDGCCRPPHRRVIHE